MEIGTHIEVLDSMYIKFYIDDKLVVDTTVYNIQTLLLPIKIPIKQHHAYFVVNGNKSNVFSFNL